MSGDANLFSDAFFFEMKLWWPDASQADAKWQDYLGVPFGTRGYNWSIKAARDLARQYCREFGEQRA